MQSTTDVLIVGGGVIGCSIAYSLRKLGVAVTVVDTGEIGAEASSAAAGLLAPLGSLPGPGPLADLLLASWSIFPSLVPELEQASGIHLAYEQSGSLRVARNPNNVVKAFARAAANLGAKFSPHTNIIGMDIRANNITRVHTTQHRGEIQCNHLIIATGAWTRETGGLLDLSLPV